MPTASGRAAGPDRRPARRSAGSPLRALTALLLLHLAGLGHGYEPYGEYSWCARHAAGMIAGDGGNRWQWRPNNPCGMRDRARTEMQAALRGCTIMFVGDSHSRYQACALWGLLADGPKGCGAQYKEDPSLRHGMFAMRHASTTIIFKWFPYLEYMHKWKNLEWFVNGTDVLVLNAGIHLLANGRKFDEAADVEGARRLAAGVRNSSHRSWPPRRSFPLVLWRETTHSQLASAAVLKRMNRHAYPPIPIPVPIPTRVPDPTLR